MKKGRLRRRVLRRIRIPHVWGRIVETGEPVIGYMEPEFFQELRRIRNKFNLKENIS